MSATILNSFSVDSNTKLLEFLDDMAFDRHFGIPKYVITMAVNKTWHVLTNYIAEKNTKLNCVSFDVLYKMFKTELYSLIGFVKSEEIFGTPTAVTWTIGFSRGGYPYAYIVIYSNKSMPTAAVDNIIHAEIPDHHIDPELYDIVKNNMIQDGSFFEIPPYFRNSGFMWPKPFSSETSIDLDDVPNYRRRQDWKTLIKNGMTYNNGYIIPYNRRLSLKYQTYVNVELHPSKFYRSDFIKDQFERLSPNNIFYRIWKDLSFPGIYRTSDVIRLPLQVEQLLAWMKCNNILDSAKELTYADFPTKFEWKDDRQEWVPRKDGVAVGRIRYVHRNGGELYYMRILLTHIKGPTSFEDIRTVGGKVYETFKDACCALGLVDDLVSSDTE